MNMISNIYKNIIVIGANSAGLAAANQARRINPDLDIKVFESGNFISYGSCSLPHYISGDVANIQTLLNYSIEYFREKKNISVFTKYRVVSVNTFKKEVTVNILGQNGFSDPDSLKVFDYDRLIICSGASPRRFEIEGANAKNIFYFRNVEDALNIRKYIEDTRPVNAVIIGGGYIGLLTAEALLKRGIKVSVVEMKEKVFSDYEEEISAPLQNVLRDSGIRLFTGYKVKKFNINNNSGDCFSVLIESVSGNDSETAEIDAGIVVMAAGIKPNTDFIESAFIEMDRSGAIKVSQKQQTSQTNVYAAGDCCLIKNIITKSFDYIPTAANAIKAGRVAGANAAGEDDIFPGSPATKVDKILDYEVARTGIGTKEAVDYRFNALKVTGEFASKVTYTSKPQKIKMVLIFDSQTRRILGAQMAGKDGVGKRIDVFATALTAEMTIDDLYMTDTSYAPYIALVPDAINRICSSAIMLSKK
ncbi:MAG: FAD-dependent oxidoreductase [Actinobacteria bacterium]|nr:FAD-dependent oxidoreductase [Actinomycetota bacterium]